MTRDIYTSGSIGRVANLWRGEDFKPITRVEKKFAELLPG